MDFQMSIGTKYMKNDYIAFRLFNAILSSLLPSFVFIILKFICKHRISCILGSIICCFEVSYICDSRFIMYDGVFLSLVSLHILVLCSKEFFLKEICLSFTLGACISSKLTSLSLIPFTFIVLMRSKSLLLSAIPCLLSILLFFFCTFWNFLLLPYSSDDANIYLSPNLFGLLYRNRSFLSLIKASLLINNEMHQLNMKNTRFHPYQSSPFSWPFLTGIWVGLWEDNKGFEINMIGNIFTYSASSISLILILFFFGNGKGSILWCVGWLFSYVPFVFVRRSVFLYHYFIPLFFSILNLSCLIDILESKNRMLMATLLVLTSIFGFFYWSPFIYGCDIDRFRNRLWFDIWEKGDKRHQTLVNQFFEK